MVDLTNNIQFLLKNCSDIWRGWENATDLRNALTAAADGGMIKEQKKWERVL